MDEEFLFGVKSGSVISYTAQSNENIFVFEPNNVTVFTSYGKVLSDFNLEIGGSTESHCLKGDELYIIKNSNGDGYILKYNWKNGKLISKTKLENTTMSKISEDKIYSFDEKYIYELNLSGKEVRRIMKPNSTEPNKKVVIDEDGNYELYIKEKIVGLDGEIYYINKSGVYTTIDGENELVLLMSLQDSKLISGNYTINDILVESSGVIYILATTGDGVTTKIMVYNKI